MRPHDVEAALVYYLSGKTSVRVSTDVPRPKETRLIRVRRTGGSPDPPIPLDPAIVLVEVWAAKDTEAFDLAVQVWEWLVDAAGGWVAPGVWCYDGNPSGPVHYPDPESKSARVQFTAVMNMSMED